LLEKHLEIIWKLQKPFDSSYRVVEHILENSRAMANFSYRHSRVPKIDKGFPHFFQDLEWQRCRTRIKVMDASGHVFLPPDRDSDEVAEMSDIIYLIPYADFNRNH